jgi:TetR/AcrR family transcriptional repressor of nem operon
MNGAPTTSEKILQCAQALLVAGGYNGFSYADIGKSSVSAMPASIITSPARRYWCRRWCGNTARQRRMAAAMERNITDPLAQLRAYAGTGKAA